LTGVLLFQDPAAKEPNKPVNVYIGSKLHENYLQFGNVPDAIVSLLDPGQEQGTTDKFRVFVLAEAVEVDGVIHATYTRAESTAVLQF